MGLTCPEQSSSVAGTAMTCRVMPAAAVLIVVMAIFAPPFSKGGARGFCPTHPPINYDTGLAKLGEELPVLSQPEA